MEAVAMDRLIDKGGATPQLALAIGEALDITLKAANLVTVPMLDARFAQHEAKMEARFSSLERALESAKVWAVLLYAGLAIAIFGALAVDHRWLLNREDQFTAQIQARTDRLFAEDDARTDKLLAEENARTDRLIAENRALIAEQQTRAARAEARIDAKFEQLRSLILHRSPKPP